MNSAPSSRAGSSLLMGALLAVLVVGVYGSAAKFDFVNWDDEFHLLQNPLMHPPTWGHIAYYWHRPYYGMYVPVTYTIWTLLGMVGRIRSDAGTLELNPYLFHSLNIAVHLISVLLVWRILTRLVQRPYSPSPGTPREGRGGGPSSSFILHPSSLPHSPHPSPPPEYQGRGFRQDLTAPALPWAAWMGAALFALHPLCVEPVAWVSGLRDLLGAMFGFAALLAYFPRANRRQNRIAYALFCLLFLLALLSKPSAVAVLPMALALDWLWFGRRLTSVLARLLPWVIVAIAAAVLTHHIQGTPPPIDIPPAWQRPLIAGDATTFYLGKFLAPLRLCVNYERSPHRVLTHGIALQNTAIALALAIAIYVLGRRWKWLWLAGALFIAGLLPVLGLTPFEFQYYSTTADRYAYMAMIGPAVALAFLLAGQYRRWLFYPAVLWLALLGVLSYQQLQTWQNTQTIFAHLLLVQPDSDQAMLKLGWEQRQEGIRLFQQAHDNRP